MAHARQVGYSSFCWSHEGRVRSRICLHWLAQKWPVLVLSFLVFGYHTVRVDLSSIGSHGLLFQAYMAWIRLSTSTISYCIMHRIFSYEEYIPSLAAGNPSKISCPLMTHSDAWCANEITLSCRKPKSQTTFGLSDTAGRRWWGKGPVMRLRGKQYSISLLGQDLTCSSIRWWIYQDILPKSAHNSITLCLGEARQNRGMAANSNVPQAQEIGQAFSLKIWIRSKSAEFKWLRPAWFMCLYFVPGYLVPGANLKFTDALQEQDNCGGMTASQASHMTGILKGKSLYH